jgi:16S rRNA (cytidine1402-2'-O)-methyltransferase
VAGPSAAAAFVSAAGFARGGYAFRGFFPRKEAERAAELVASAGQTALWFESPERITSALASVSAFCLANPTRARGARVVVAKELTKVHERFFQGTPQEAAAAVDSEIRAQGARGEWCFGWEIPAPPEAEVTSAEQAADAPWRLALGCLLRQGVSASRAAKEVSQAFGVAKNLVYSVALTVAEKK